MIQSIQQFDMSVNQIKWVIFLMLLALFPAVFFLVFDVAVWPVLIVALRIFPTVLASGQYALIVVFLLEILFWGGVFYFLSSLLANGLSRINYQLKFSFLLSVILVIIGLAMFPHFDFYQGASKTNVSAFYLYLSDERLF